MSNSISRSLLVLILPILTTFSALTAFAAEKIGLPSVAPYAEDTDVRSAVENECSLEEKVAQFVDSYARNGEFADNTGSGKYLNMEITEVYAAGGGAFSGPKWMEVSGTLTNNGEPVASFRAKRFSSGGAFGGFKGNCSILGRCAKAIGKDIANWLKDPYDGAELGDAR